ncbi:MAG TPA: peptidoglycan DD-metalloendopeptidase family protein [Dongiaceae bacterium]
MLNKAVLKRLAPILSATAILGGGLMVFAPSGFAGDQEPQDLNKIQQQIQDSQQQQAQLKAKAAQLDQEISELQGSLVKAAGQVQDTESQVTELEETLAALSDEEKEKTAALKTEQATLTQAVLALQRLSSQPQEALLFSSEPPIDAARTARLLSLITPALDARARALQSDLNELREMRQEMAQKRSDLSGAVNKLATDNKRLTGLIARKFALQRSTLAESAAAQGKLDKLAGQAKNLQDLMDRLAKAKAAAELAAKTKPSAITDADIGNGDGTGVPEPDMNQQTASLEGTTGAPPDGGASAAQRMTQPAGFRNFPAAAQANAANHVFAPARGRILTHFGDPSASGGVSKGLVLETRPGAQIVAPFDGHIVFEGPFRSYGQILIIEHGGGYHTVLAGLDRVDAVVGQWLLAGEPVGNMADPASGRPKLYLELRRDGQPIDPVPWFGTAEANAVNNKGQ